MLYIKCVIICFIWVVFIKNALLKYKKIVYENRLISSFSDTLEEAIISMSYKPSSFADVVLYKDNYLSEFFKRKNTYFFIDPKIYELTSAFENVFRLNDTSVIKSNLYILKEKLSIINKVHITSKENIIRNDFYMNGLITLGITILII